jgi:hypothetical protein
MTQTRSRIEAAPLGWLLVCRIVAGMIARLRLPASGENVSRTYFSASELAF